MKQRITEQQLLQNYNVLFENIVKDTVLAAELAEYGYTAEEIANGKALYEAVTNKYNVNKKETAEETTAYAVFSEKLNSLLNTYRTDRKKAKIVFINQPDVLKNLHVKSLVPTRNAAVLDNIKVFYNTLNQNADLLTSLQQLKVTPEHVNKQLALVTETEAAYAQYIQEKGESQQATQDKNNAFNEMDLWIRRFYAVAKIALEDQPQLLEGVAKLVRS